MSSEKKKGDDKDCEHAKYKSDVNFSVVEIKSLMIKQLMVRLKIRCAACGAPFIFEGPAGFSTEQPMVSPDMTELRAPAHWPLRLEEEDDGEEKETIH